MKTRGPREIPSVDKVLRALGDAALPRPAVVAVIRRELAALRSSGDVPSTNGVLDRIQGALRSLRRSRIQPVINATGVVIHTNLGRSPMGAAVADTLGTIATRYSNLEMDLETGGRGGRASYLEHNLSLLCGSQAATVVNNCAAALVLILRLYTAQRNEVLISRGELVQIGGGFRIPDILEASGATLREVGATNKTTLDDYAKHFGPRTGLVLKVHRSNFFMDGFVASPSTPELAAWAKKKRVPLVEDLGSGAVVPTEQGTSMDHEPTPAEVLRQGVDLVCFSGDKLLGGPQAGIVAGRAREVARLKKEPFFRAVRCDKLILAALETTVDAYLNLADRSPQAAVSLPVWNLFTVTEPALRSRAQSLLKRVRDLPLDAEIAAVKSPIGGGTLPRSSVASITLDLRPKSLPLTVLSSRLRTGDPPVIGVVSGGRLRLDLRTVFPDQDAALERSIRQVFEPLQTHPHPSFQP